MSNNTTYYGVSLAEQLKMIAQGDIQAKANAEVYDRALRASEERCLAQQRHMQDTQKLKEERVQAEKQRKQWINRNIATVEKIQAAVAPNIPESRDETLQIIDYVNTMKEMPAPWNAEKIRKDYQKLITAWMQNDVNKIRQYTDMINIWWHQSLIAVYMHMTRYPGPVPFNKCLPKLDAREHQQYVRNHALPHTPAYSYLIPAQREQMEYTDPHWTKSYGRQLTAYWDYLTTYDNELKPLATDFRTPESAVLFDFRLSDIF